MSKRTRVLFLAAMVAAMTLAGPTAIAQAHTNDDTASKRHRALGQAQLGVAGGNDAPEPPLQRQVGEPYRYYHDALAGQERATRADAVEQVRRGEWASLERADNTTNMTAQETLTVRPTQSSGQPAWLVVSLGGVVAALPLVAGLALLAVRRTNRRGRVGQPT